MPVQTGAKAVNEGDGTDVQGGLVHTQSIRAGGLQALCDGSQGSPQNSEFKVR